MSLLFSRECEYALQAMAYLGLHPTGTFVSIAEMSKRLEIPYHFLGKIFQKLSTKNLVYSQKGPDGGFSLLRPAQEITLLDIVEAIDGTDFLKQCVMGFPECDDKNPCAVHTTWLGIRDALRRMLVSENLDEIARGTKKASFRNR